MFFRKLKEMNIGENIKKSFYSTTDFISKFIKDTKYKLKHLYETNYKVGLYHMEHGNLWDASFRFKLMKWIYPDKLEAQYQYAVCLVLQGFNKDAETLLTEILEKNKNYTEAAKLLNKIKNKDTKSMVDEYNKKIAELKKKEDIKKKKSEKATEKKKEEKTDTSAKKEKKQTSKKNSKSKEIKKEVKKTKPKPKTAKEKSKKNKK